MSEHEKFHYKNERELLGRARELGVHIPMAADTKVLGRKLRVRNVTLPNRLGIAPMEGADALADGSPSELTMRRYVREAEGGSAVIWFEAISIVPEGRSSPRQLMLTRENLPRYRALCETVKEAGRRAHGFAPFLIMQANHSGRYSNSDGRPAPMIAYRHPEYEKFRPADDSCIVTDDYLRSLEEKFGEAARLASEAGFDAVDIKSCHGYLLAELLSAYSRPGLYGGSFENRTRLLRNGIRAAQVWENDRFMVTARIGIFDGYPWPYGFGVPAGRAGSGEDGDSSGYGPRDESAAAGAAEEASGTPQGYGQQGGSAAAGVTGEAPGTLQVYGPRGEGTVPDPAEPIRLVRELKEELGVAMVNLTMGNPYVTTHVTRPFDGGKYVPREHPLSGVARMIGGIGQVKRAVPEMVISASGPSYLRQYSDLFAAGAIEEGLCDAMLFGRMSFANPAFADQILSSGRIDAGQVCVACGKCGDLIRAGKPTGCVVRDAGTYLSYFREYQEEERLRGL